MSKGIFKKVKVFFILILSGLFGFLIGYAHLFGNEKPIEFELDSLQNGLKIIYNIDRTAPVVSTVLHYRVGSRDETPGKTGYAHFFEHLMFEGTKDIPRGYVDKYVQDAGGNLNAGTSFDQTVYYFQLPANEIKLALWIESQRMRNLLVDTIGVETQRRVVLEEMKSRTTNQAYGTFLEKVCSNLFPNTNYSWEVLGYANDIERATIEDFRNFYDKYYQPSNTTLVISGDFNLVEVKNYVKEYFGSFKPVPEPQRQKVQLKPLEKGYREVINDEKVQLPGVFLTYRGPDLMNPDYYACSLLSEILASGESSRLYQRLVNKDQIAVQVSMYPLSLQYVGGLSFIGIATPGTNIEDVEGTILEEIKNVVKNGVTKEELEKAKNITETNLISAKKSTLEKAQNLAEYYSNFGNPGLINTEIDKYLNVTNEDILRVAKKYLDTDKNVTLIYLPKN